MGAGGWAVSLAGARGGGGTITDLSDTQMTLCGKSLEASVDEARFELGLEEWVGFQGAGMGQSKGNEADAQDARGAAGSLVWLGGMHGGGEWATKEVGRIALRPDGAGPVSLGGGTSGAVTIAVTGAAP